MDHRLHRHLLASALDLAPGPDWARRHRRVLENEHGLDHPVELLRPR